MMSRSSAHTRKVYLKVRADHLPDGRIVPLMFRAEDGDAVRVDRVLDVREAPSLKVGGQGTRYTCRVGDKQIYLFHDTGKWFFEDPNAPV